MNGAMCAMILLAAAVPRTEPDLKTIRFEQKLGGEIPRNAIFKNEEGRDVALGELLGKKPVILVPGYYTCPMLCTVVANGLIESLQELKLNIGADFSVVHFSVNPRETPADAASKKSLYLKRYGRDGAAQGWHFLTGSEPAIRQLAEAIGFHYAYDPASREYAHPSGVVVLTPDGKIARYFFGVNFAPNEMRAALLDAAASKVGSPLHQLALLCFHYNPITGKYGLAILKILRVGGVATVAAIALFIGLAMKREQPRRPS